MKHLNEAVANRKSGKYIDVSQKKKLSEWTHFEVSKLRDTIDEFVYRKKSRTRDKYCLDTFSEQVLDLWMLSLEKGRDYSIDNVITIGDLKMMYDAVWWKYGTVKDDSEKDDLSQYIRFITEYFQNRWSGSGNLDAFVYTSVYPLKPI